MHDPQHVHPPRLPPYRIEDPIVRHAEAVVGVFDTSESFDAASALLRRFVGQVPLHCVGNLRCIVLPQPVQVLDRPALQNHLIRAHRKTLS
jgi:hypothetical protein